MSYKISARLTQLAHAVADQNWSEFSMRIPADSEHDADLVLLNAAREIDRLRAELAEARKPDCRTCARLIQEADGPICSRAWVTRDLCVGGNHYEYQPSLVRLYEKEGQV